MIKLRISEAELKEIHQHLGRSTNRSLSEYIRRLALNKPVTVKVRNASADDFLEQMLPLQACLEQACDTYTKAVDRLQTLHKLTELKGWLILHESTRAALLEQVSRMESLTLQLYEQWLQK
nr:plasmid mobilization relaxosome protein MobC [Cnuella takakiae]